MMKKLFFLFTLFVTSHVWSAPLLIGTAPQNPPFESLADPKGDFFGFDIEIMGEICKRIHAQCKFVPTIHNALFANIKSGKINLAISAIIITPASLGDYLFSLPYLQSNAQFITLQSSSIKIPGDIENKTIGVRHGTPFQELARSLYHNVKVIEYPVVDDLMEALRKNDIDIILLNKAAAVFWSANNSGVYKLIGEAIPFGEGYAVMANTGQEALIAQVNQALLNMEADGTYLKIYRQYF